MRKVIFAKGEIYHIYNRGVEKRNIFLDDEDYLRFTHNLFEFNDEAPAVNIYYKQQLYKQLYETKSHKIKIERKKRKLLVEILAFCLMPNHFHLLLRETKEGGIVKFMHKLGVGYSMYFNQKYNRIGRLFQGPFKAVLVEKDTHFRYLPYYIHFNPLDLKFSNWRKGEIKNYRSAMKFLESYRWSSFLDYIGKKNFPSVTQREFLNEFFGGPEEYKKDMMEWLRNIDLDEIKNVILE